MLSSEVPEVLERVLNRERPVELSSGNRDECGEVVDLGRPEILLLTVPKDGEREISAHIPVDRLAGENGKVGPFDSVEPDTELGERMFALSRRLGRDSFESIVEVGLESIDAGFTGVDTHSSIADLQLLCENSQCDFLRVFHLVHL